MVTFGYEQTVKYEVARDLLNRRRAALSAQLGRECAQRRQDAAAIGRIQGEMRDVATRLRRLDVTDEAALDAVIAAHSSSWLASVA